MITALVNRPDVRFHPMLWAGATMTLSVPAFAVLMTSEMSWGPEDFVAFGLMLTGFSLSIEAAWYWLDTPLKRLCAVIFAVLAFLIVWAELAVGLFD